MPLAPVRSLRALGAFTTALVRLLLLALRVLGPNGHDLQRRGSNKNGEQTALLSPQRQPRAGGEEYGPPDYVEQKMDTDGATWQRSAKRSRPQT